MLPNWSIQPYPFELSLKRRLRHAAYVGSFITLFLGVFQPFGLSTYPSTWALALGYGLVTFTAMIAIDLVLSFSKVDAQRWTLGKEMWISILNILFIGLLNSVYSAWMGVAAFTLWNIALFTLYTLAIGVFPVLGLLLINFQRDRTRYAEASETLNAGLHERQQEVEEEAAVMVLLEGENQSERLEVKADALLFLRSSDNYVEVHHDQGRKILRGALKSFEDQLKHLPQFFRCHKSYLVNMELVERVSGNAQGLKLHLKHGHEVPVSRSLTAEVRQRLTKGPAVASHSPRRLPVHPKA